MSDEHLPGVSLLDAVRPPPGWRVDRALISTYSAEPAAIAAVLLAMVGRDDERGLGSKVGLARALLELRGRVAVVHQRGRLAAPRRGGAAIRILDRYVRAVPWNEGRSEEGPGQSWHPKCALVRLMAEEGDAILWRFHFGSRNLTRDLSWDIGLRLDGRPGGDSGERVTAVAKVAQRLADKAAASDVWAPLVAELRSVRWDVPRGLAIERLDLFLPEDKPRSLPKQPEGVGEVVAVSPFLDGTAVGKISKWGEAGTKRILMSSRPELAKLNRQSSSPLGPFNTLLVLPATGESQETSEGEDTDSTDTAVEARGLHAKFLWAEHVTGATMWLGSANLTERGWTRNAELVAEIAVERRGNAAAVRELEQGIRAFVEYADEIKKGDLARDSADEPTDLDRLEEARRQVAVSLDARQRLRPDGRVGVSSSSAPHPENADIELSLGPIAGALVKWPRGQAEIVLPAAAGSAPSDLLVVRLDLKDESVSWTQAFPFDPPLDASQFDRRDASVLGDWLGARGMMRAIGELLDNASDGDGSGDRWDGEDGTTDAGRGARTGTKASAPSLEQALRAWMRDPGRLELIEQLLTAVPQAGVGLDEAEAREQLERFRRTWATLRESLAEGHRGG